MSDELSLSATLKCTKMKDDAKLTITERVANLLVDMSGNTITKGVQSIGTSKEDLELHTDHSTLGWCFLLNIEASGGNYVSFGVDGDTPLGELKPGEFALFRISRGQSSISMKADTDAVKTYFAVFED